MHPTGNSLRLISPQLLRVLKAILIVATVLLLIKNCIGAETFIHKRLNSDQPIEWTLPNAFIFCLAGLIFMWVNVAILVLWTLRRNIEGPVLALACLQLALIVVKLFFLYYYWTKDNSLLYHVSSTLVDVAYFVLLFYYAMKVCEINEAAVSEAEAAVSEAEATA